MADNKKQYLTVKAGNAMRGTTKNGNPWVRIGLVVKAGARKGEWVNYFKVITPKTKPHAEKDMKTMGVTDLDNFTTDGRLFTAVWGWDEFYQEDRVVSVLDSKFKPDVMRDDNAGPNKGDDGDVF